MKSKMKNFLTSCRCPIIRGFLSLFLTATALTGCAQSSKNNNLNSKNMKAIEINKADFLTKVANIETSPKEWKYLGDKPAIVDFFATWCGPCRALAPVLEEVAGEYGDSLNVYKIDVDKEEELASFFGIRSIPTLLFIPMQGNPQMVVGGMAKSDLKKVIDNTLLKK